MGGCAAPGCRKSGTQENKMFVFPKRDIMHTDDEELDFLYRTLGNLYYSSHVGDKEKRDAILEVLLGKERRVCHRHFYPGSFIQKGKKIMVRRDVTRCVRNKTEEAILTRGLDIDSIHLSLLPGLVQRRVTRLISPQLLEPPIAAEPTMLNPTDDGYDASVSACDPMDDAGTVCPEHTSCPETDPEDQGKSTATIRYV